MSGRFALVALLVLAGALPALAGPSTTELLPGNGKDGFNLVITGDGWSDEDLKTKWPAAVQSVVDGLFTIDPYSYLKNAFHVVRIDVASKQHGCRFSDPPTCFRKDLGYEFDDDGKLTKSPPEWTDDKKKEMQLRETHYGLTWSGCTAPTVTADVRKKLKDDLGDIPCTVAIIITPDEEINNGCSSPGDPYVIIMNTIDKADMGDFKGTLAHELGHAFFRLGDEYPGRKKKPTNEPEQPNCTLNNDKETVKWGYLTKTISPGGMGAPDCYHGLDPCRMNDVYPYPERFCIVCAQAMTERVSAQYRFIESTDPSGSILPKYTALNPIHFKVKMRGSSASEYAMSWVYDGKNLGPGTVTPGGSGPTSEFTLNRPPMSFGIHRMSFLVEDQHNIIKKNPDAVDKAPQSKDWWLTIAPSNPILPLPGIDWSW